MSTGLLYWSIVVVVDVLDVEFGKSSDRLLRLIHVRVASTGQHESGTVQSTEMSLRCYVMLKDGNSEQDPAKTDCILSTRKAEYSAIENRRLEVGFSRILTMS